MSNIPTNINFPLVTELSTVPVDPYGESPSDFEYSTDSESTELGRSLVLPRIYPYTIRTNITTNQDNIVEVCKIDLAKGLSVPISGREKDIGVRNSFRSYNRAVKVVFITGASNSSNQLGCYNNYYFSIAVDADSTLFNRFLSDFTYEWNYEAVSAPQYKLIYGGFNNPGGAMDFLRFKIDYVYNEGTYPVQTYANNVSGDFTNTSGVAQGQSVFAVNDGFGAILTLEMNLRTSFFQNFTYTNQRFHGWVELI